MNTSAAKTLLRGHRAKAGRVVREAKLHVDRVRQPGDRPRAILFASQADSGGSGYLRAHAVGMALRARGWRTVMPNAHLSLSQRRRIVALERPDVILLQQARHPLNRPRYYPGVPTVFDLDDADILDERCASDVIECVAQSKAAIAGSRYVANLLKPHNPNVSVVWTCVDRDISAPVTPQRARGPVVSWASLNPAGFALEAEMIQRAMVALAGKTRFTFRLYGVRDRWGVRSSDWAERYVAPIRAAGAEIELIPLLDYDAFLTSLQSVAVGLQPVCPEDPHSAGRSFGKVLAYLIAGAAVVASDAVDHPLFFHDRQNGLLVPNQPEAWANACAELLANTELRERVATAGREDLGRRLVVSTAAEHLDRIFRGVLAA